jgi:hypothetical protein
MYRYEYFKRCWSENNIFNLKKKNTITFKNNNSNHYFNKIVRINIIIVKENSFKSNIQYTVL